MSRTNGFRPINASGNSSEGEFSDDELRELTSSIADATINEEREKSMNSSLAGVPRSAGFNRVTRPARLSSGEMVVSGEMVASARKRTSSPGDDSLHDSKRFQTSSVANPSSGSKKRAPSPKTDSSSALDSLSPGIETGSAKKLKTKSPNHDVDL